MHVTAPFLAVWETKHADTTFKPVVQLITQQLTTILKFQRDRIKRTEDRKFSNLTNYKGLDPRMCVSANHDQNKPGVT